VANRTATLYLAALTVILIDQVSKALIVATLPLYDSVTIIPRVLDFTYVRNTGMAFGLLQESTMPYKRLVTGALALAALAGITMFARTLTPEEKWSRFGLALILGGALGNLIDRARVGYVVDFVDVYWRGWHFWAFNVADAAINVGAAFVFGELFLRSRHASRPV
jgi:signal peptidase II